jgi:hypothetical protein
MPSATPDDHHRPAGPGLAEQRNRGIGHRPGEHRRRKRAAAHHRGRVHDDARDVAEPIGVESEEEQTGLGGDGDAHLLGDVHASSRLELVVREEDSDQRLEALPLATVQVLPVAEAGPHDRPPLLGKRTAERSAPAALQERHPPSGVGRPARVSGREPHAKRDRPGARQL